MKQVIFAIALLAMASLTGCLTDDESSVDETTDTTSDNTGNTNDNSDTNQDDTDSGDSGMIDPVGTDGGVSIPEDSSIFIDNAEQIYQRIGEWECLEEYLQRTECEFVNFERGFLQIENGAPVYYDPDVTYDSLKFNGWVNKTGNTVSIEGLYYPDRASFILEGESNADVDGDGTYDPNTPWTSNEYLGKPVTNVCQEYNCYAVFYGNNGLTYNTWFNLLKSTYHYDDIDDDNDGFEDSIYRNYHYQHLSVEINLPFEPYGFSISYDSNSDSSLDRIF